MSSHYPDCLFWLTDRNVLCILLFLLIVCFHWSWLWSTLPTWIYHFIIITSLSLFFSASLKLLSFLDCTPILWRLIFLYVPSFLATVLPAVPTHFIALLLWVEHWFLTSSPGFLPCCNFSGLDFIVSSEGVCGFYWKQSTLPVAYLMQKGKLSDPWVNWYLPW